MSGSRAKRSAPRRPGAPVAIELIALLAAGCTFDTSGPIPAASDGGRADSALSGADAPSADGPAADACPEVDPDTIALYHFETVNGVPDAAGSHDGAFRGGVTLITGPCGHAMSPIRDMDGYVELPDSPDWDLPSGSIDLMVQAVEVTSGSAGVIGRDASGSETGGQLSMWIAQDGTFVVRIQEVGDGPGGSTLLCSEQHAVAGQWYHVGVNFGSADEIWVDGELGIRTDPVTLRFGTFPCNQDGGLGLDGTDNPWVLGADTADSAEGSATPLDGDSYLDGGSIDELRVSRVPRDFSR